MSDPIRVVTSLPPTDNNIYRGYCRRCKGSKGITFHKMPDAKAWEDRADVAVAAQAPAVALSRPIAVSVRLYAPALYTFDLHGRLKLLMDAMNGRVWGDDREVTRIMLEKFVDKQNPRAELRAVAAQSSLDLPHGGTFDIHF